MVHRPVIFTTLTSRVWFEVQQDRKFVRNIQAASCLKLDMSCRVSDG